MKLTLWLLNRCVDWEQDHPKAMAEALASAGHDIVLGQRCMANSPPGDPCCSARPGVVAVAVNDRLCSRRGALMHEGARTDDPPYDEYFVPIPVKCIGDPRDENQRLVRFWSERLPPDSTVAIAFMKIIDDGINPCFKADFLKHYWRDPDGHPCPPQPATAAWPFGDVRMNTTQRIGLYEILRRQTAATGRKNVLVGYSQGGLVARYLAYLDETFAPEDQCVHGVVAVQAPLRGSPLATASHAGWIAAALTSAVLSIGKDPSEGGGPPPPAAAPAAHDCVRGQSVFRALGTLLEQLIEANTGDPKKSIAIDGLRTARKWISGLTGDEGTAFHDLDLERLEQVGAVLDAVGTPLRSTWHGAVVGSNDRLEPVVRGLVVRKLLWRLLERAGRGYVTKQLKAAEALYRDGAMAIAGAASPPLVPPRLQELLLDCKDPRRLHLSPSIHPGAHDLVISSASQVMKASPAHEASPSAPATTKDATSRYFLGNEVNEDASHLTGARLSTCPRNDLELTRTLLRKMGPAPSPLR